MDEPFNGLDRDGRKGISKLIKDYISGDRIILLTSHIDGDIDQLADDVFEIKNGSVCLKTEL